MKRIDTYWAIAIGGVMGSLAAGQWQVAFCIAIVFVFGAALAKP